MKKPKELKSAPAEITDEELAAANGGIAPLLIGGAIWGGRIAIGLGSGWVANRAGRFAGRLSRRKR